MKKFTHEVGKVAYQILKGSLKIGNSWSCWEAVRSQPVLLSCVFALMLIEKPLDSDLALVAVNRQAQY